MSSVEATDEEREYEKAISDKGFAITTEEPDHKIGNMAHYRVVIKKLGTDEEVEALGDDRESALKAALSIASAT